MSLTKTALSILGAQLNFIVGDIENNAERIIETLLRAREDQHDLVVFPELTLTGYPPEDLLYRPALYQRCQKALEKILPHTQNIAALIGTPADENGKRYNTALLLQNGKQLASYAKQHLPNETVFDEARYFTPGTETLTFELNGFRLGVLVCEDAWHSPAGKKAKEQGAEAIIVMNASPFDRYKKRVRENTLKQRAAETNIPWVYVNLVGGQDELVFDGGSMVIDAQGNHVIQAPYYEEALVPVVFEKSNANATVTNGLPTPAHLSDEENIYRALVLGLRDYVHKNGFQEAVLGLSGGIDSALTLAIAVDALGAEHISTLMLPSPYTAKISFEDAQEQIDALQVAHQTLAIDALYQTALGTLSPIFKGQTSPVTAQNIQARLRCLLLMAISNNSGAILLTTSNKSEMSVGYSTLYGDMAGGFSVLKDIPKTLVYALARYRNNLSPVIPARVLTRAPSAELAPDQKDSDTLPPYDILDPILERYIDLDQDPREICRAGFEKKVVERIARLVDRSEYKRRQAAPGIRISRRAFGKDRRYPITSKYLLPIPD